MRKEILVTNYNPKKLKELREIAKITHEMLQNNDSVDVEELSNLEEAEEPIPIDIFYLAYLYVNYKNAAEKNGVNKFPSLTSDLMNPHLNGLMYQEFIANHNNYRGLPVNRKSNGQVKWVATIKTPEGQLRVNFWEKKRIEHGIESDSGDVMFQGSNQSVAIGAMSVTSSQLSTFNTSIIPGLSSGANVGPYQITLPSVIDKTGSEDTFPYTGSAEITGSLEVTGSVDFLINSGETFKVSNTLSPTQSLFTINQEGVAIFRAREGSDGTPTVVPGAMYFTTESVFFGFDDGV